MASLQQISNNLDVAYDHHQAGNYAFSIPIHRALLAYHVLPPIVAVECHIMLITARVPEALEHSVSANIIARELLEEFPDNEKFQQLYDISQNLLRTVQRQNREERDSIIQQSLALSGGSSKQPQSRSVSPAPSSTTSAAGRQYQASGFGTTLATILEEPGEDEEPALDSSSRPVYHNRRISSLSRAMENIVRNMGSYQRR